jgi:hypothetical protein
MKIFDLKVNQTLEGIAVARHFSVYKNEDAASHSTYHALINSGCAGVAVGLGIHSFIFFFLSTFHWVSKSRKNMVGR